MTTLAAKLFGAAKVIVTDVVDNPLSVAKSIGADANAPPLALYSTVTVS